MDITELPLAIRNARIRAGLSQNQLGELIYPEAKRLNAGRRIRGFELGTLPITLHTLQQLGAVLNFEINIEFFQKTLDM